MKQEGNGGTEQHEECCIDKCTDKATRRLKLLGADIMEFCEKHFQQYRRGKRQIDRVCFILDVGAPPHKVKSDTGLGAGQETRALL
jgi:hypothetical protein